MISTALLLEYTDSTEHLIDLFINIATTSAINLLLEKLD